MADGNGTRLGGKRNMSSRDGSSKSPETHRTSSRLHDKLNKQGSSESPRIMLRLGPRSLPTLHPGNVPPVRRFGSLQELIAQDDPLQGEEEHRLTEKEASKEASIRYDLIEASKPGGLLGILALEEDKAEEPFCGYSYPDYLTKHVFDLQQRIQRESREHRAAAKRLAHAAVAAVRAKMPKTAEELEVELHAKGKENLKSVLRQYKSHLEMASQQIMALKRDEFFSREAAQGREQMKEWVDRSEGLLSARTGHNWTEQQNGDRSDSELVSMASDADDKTSDEELDDNEDGDSATSSEDEVGGYESDDALTAEQLRAKYADVLEHQRASEDQKSPSPEAFNESGIIDMLSVRHEQFNNEDEEESTERTGSSHDAPAPPDLEEVDDMLLDEDGKETDTSGTPTTSDESMSESEGESSEESDGGDGADLLGFLSSKDIQALKEQRLRQGAEGEEEEGTSCIDKVLDGSEAVPLVNGFYKSPTKIESKEPIAPPDLKPVPQSSYQSPSSNSKDMAQTHMEQEAKPIQSPLLGSEKVSTPPNALNYSHQNGAPKIAIPPLIRGHLRPYQHAGFEWLAGMYENATNGILADEMGLGKTFQTIALLAHLATHRHVWGPHLIIVPTSVILNWEIEFKKFLPGFKVLSYYGSQSERQEKRKGWNDLDKWNVCITSYQLALSDQVILKRRPWHYLVLDEAHNIKNYKSQRWQALLSFKSQARLLLTGTPLQNNLAELWSLLFFLAPEQDAEGRTSFGDLAEFSKVFHRPVDQILEHGRGALDEEAMSIVSKLHQVLRPHLLRRLKADVETQMPKKYEHVTVCRLSKRQRQLYDGYMGLANTRESFASGNYMSIINCLMQLRKVCNHPDLFETRQIVTSFAMPKSAIADYEIKELLVRRRLFQDDLRSANAGLCHLWQPNTSFFAESQGRALLAVSQFTSILERSYSRNRVDEDDQQDVISVLKSVGEKMRQRQTDYVSSLRQKTTRQMAFRPLYTTGLLDRLRIQNLVQIHAAPLNRVRSSGETYLSRSSVLRDLVLNTEQRSESFEPLIERFACTTPHVTAPGIAQLSLTDVGKDMIDNSASSARRDAFHEARVRLSIAFPDKSLIQYDCGKLQQLDKLLRKLQSGGHRAVIFTQMTKVLDILEQFMNLHGHRYLRLDGATKIEQRQIITERFNSDTRILAFICSSRSGGLGINLTGADTVIFYDLDWNPAMDKQCQDRCHRIGQTRDVHIYRFVSEGTIEANILRKSNQKRMLDDVVIQEGEFTTEYFNRIGFDDGNEETDAAIDKVFGGGGSRMLQQAEDKEDQDAAKEAQKEDLQADDADFSDRVVDRPASGGAARRSPAGFAEKPSDGFDSTKKMENDHALAPSMDHQRPNPENLDATAREQLLDLFASKPLSQDKPLLRDVDAEGNAAPAGTDEYLVRLMAWELRDIVWMPPKSAKDKKKKKKGAEFGIIRR